MQLIYNTDIQTLVKLINSTTPIISELVYAKPLKRNFVHRSEI